MASCLSLLATSLTVAPDLAALFRPREVEDGDKEERVAAIGNTGKGIVPSQKGSEHSEGAASLNEPDRSSHSSIVISVGAAGEHEKGEVECEEQHEEHDGGAQCAQKQDGGEDKPARQEETDCRLAHFRIDGQSCWCLVRATFAEDIPIGRQQNAVGDPETSVRGERGGTEGVANSHFPHAREELDKTAVAESKGNDNVRCIHAASAQVDTRQDEGGQGEGTETQWRRVGEFAGRDWLVQTGLELTTKGGQSRVIPRVNVCHGVVVLAIVVLGAGVACAIDGMHTGRRHGRCLAKLFLSRVQFLGHFARSWCL